MILLQRKFLDLRYSGLYEEGDIEHINVPPETVSHIDMHAQRPHLASHLL